MFFSTSSYIFPIIIVSLTCGKAIYININILLSTFRYLPIMFRRGTNGTIIFILYDVTRAMCQTYFVCSYNIISIYYLLYCNIFPTLYLPRFFHSVIIIIISRAVGSPHYSRGTQHYNITRKYICLKSENVI